MKILYSHRTHSADGQNVHIRELTTALAARDHEIIMAAPETETVRRTDARQSAPRGLKAWLPAPAYEIAELGYNLPAYARASRLANAHRPDIIYERYNLFFHAGSWLKKKRNLPMLLEVNAPLADERAAHGNLALQGLARRSEHAIWRAADMVLPVSQALATRVVEAGAPPERVHVIHNGVSEAFLQSYDPALIRQRYGLEGKLVLGFVGFMREWHQVDRVIRFLAGGGRHDLRLLVVGEGPAREPLEALAAELNVTAQIIFTGAVERAELPGLIAAFDIALQPAVVDYASPLKLFEYMALGKATLAPDSSNIREILTDGQDAMLFDPRDKGAFDRTLARLVEDTDLRAQLGAAARESLLRQGLTWAENAHRVERIAERLLESKT
ncbi:MAG: glycosyltransferase family 4 protein [Pseudomonadota bacterium]